MASPRWTLSTYDLKSWGLYVVTALALWVLANLTDVETSIVDWMIQHGIDPVWGAVVFAAVVILAKKLVQWQNDLSS